MKFTAALLLFSCVSLAQSAAPGTNQKQILANPRVTASTIEIPANSAIVAGKHDRDLLTVIIGDRKKSNLASGRVFFTPANSDERNRY